MFESLTIDPHDVAEHDGGCCGDWYPINTVAVLAPDSQSMGNNNTDLERGRSDNNTRNVPVAFLYSEHRVDDDDLVSPNGNAMSHRSRMMQSHEYVPQLVHANIVGNDDDSSVLMNGHGEITTTVDENAVIQVGGVPNTDTSNNIYSNIAVTHYESDVLSNEESALIEGLIATENSIRAIESRMINNEDNIIAEEIINQYDPNSNNNSNNNVINISNSYISYNSNNNVNSTSSSNRNRHDVQLVDIV
jgi:hypothetical protein